MLLENVKQYIIDKQLVMPGDALIVGFSGGADSTALVHILYRLQNELKFTLTAAHLHHGIRGEEADRDLEFAKQFCGQFNINFKYKKCDIPTIAAKEKISEETAGREERYRFFSELAGKNGKIATAHNKNDNAETVVHHIIRGSGINGICGIAAKRGNIIRPLINVERREIECYCEENGLEYVTDSTNAEIDYTRNKIRHCVLYEMQKINPQIISAVCRTASLANDDNDYIEIETEKAYEKYVTYKDGQAVYAINKELHNAIEKRIFIKMAHCVGATPDFEQVNAMETLVRQGKTGKKIDITGGTAEISYNNLIVHTKNEKCEFDVLYKNKKIYISECGLFAMPEKGGIILPENAEIHIRNRRNGDRIKVNGMTKKIKDIFISKKIPQFERDRIPVVTVNGEVVCVYGTAYADVLKKYTKNAGKVVLKFKQGEYNNE